MQADTAYTVRAYFLAVFSRWCASIREWREQESLRVSLHHLSDRELRDIGIERGEVDYVSRRFSDPRIYF